jgi:hypothetical protein
MGDSTDYHARNKRKQKGKALHQMPWGSVEPQPL